MKKHEKKKTNNETEKHGFQYLNKIHNQENSWESQMTMTKRLPLILK